MGFLDKLDAGRDDLVTTVELLGHGIERCMNCLVAHCIHEEKKTVKSGFLAQEHAHAVTPRALHGAQACYSAAATTGFVQSLPSYGQANAVNLIPLATDGSRIQATTPHT